MGRLLSVVENRRCMGLVLAGEGPHSVLRTHQRQCAPAFSVVSPGLDAFRTAGITVVARQSCSSPSVVWCDAQRRRPRYAAGRSSACTRRGCGAHADAAGQRQRVELQLRTLGIDGNAPAELEIDDMDVRC